jgi:mono/diheme cytochrome c family protein
MKKILLLILLAVTAASCYWENEETLFPAGECDTADVSYSKDIVQILSSNCYTCHSNANALNFGNGFTFEDYEDVAASSTRILGSIKHENGFNPMPRNREKLDSCQIMIFETWVNDGTPDN